MTATTEAPRLESGAAIAPDGRADWLAARRGGIGASDAPAILGLDPYRTPLDIFAEKLGLAAPEGALAADDPRALGLMAEPMLSRLYERRSGRSVVRSQVFCRPGDAEPFFATLDGLNDAGWPVEFKWVGRRHTAYLDQLGDDDTDEMPDAWITQAHIQMRCTGADLVDFAVMAAGEPRYFQVRRSEALMRSMAPRLLEFWGRVQRRDPPPATRTSDIKSLAALYRESRGEVELAESAMDAAREYEQYGRGIREWQGLRDNARLKLLAALGPADVGRLPDGRTVRRSVIEVKAHEVKAGTQVRLSIRGGES